ncbi:MAG: hypothetical protein WCF36_17700 [Candidatus Nanopelagicales bacterium]
MDRLLVDYRHIVVSGTVSNQGRFYDRFEHVVLLSAPVDVLLERVSGRTNNPYGREPDQQAEIVRYVATVEPLLRRGATLEHDGRRPPAELADIRWRVLLAAATPVVMYWAYHHDGGWPGVPGWDDTVQSPLDLTVQITAVLITCAGLGWALHASGLGERLRTWHDSAPATRTPLRAPADLDSGKGATHNA